MSLATQCPRILQQHCRLCGPWLGWRDHPDALENVRIWQEWVVKQQADHEALWSAEIDNLSLVPKT